MFNRGVIQGRDAIKRRCFSAGGGISREANAVEMEILPFA
jgi:hypothetical protein